MHLEKYDGKEVGEREREERRNNSCLLVLRPNFHVFFFFGVSRGGRNLGEREKERGRLVGRRREVVRTAHVGEEEVVSKT